MRSNSCRKARNSRGGNGAISSKNPKRHQNHQNGEVCAHPEDELSESIRVLVVEQESVAGVSCCRLKQQQEELLSDWTGLEEADQHLQQFTQLQHTHIYMQVLLNFKYLLSFLASSTCL